MIEPASKVGGAGGFTLVEVLAALGLVASLGVAALSVAGTLAAMLQIARAEAVGLALAAEKLEDLIATPADQRAEGFDEVESQGLAVRRLWRVRRGDPAPGLTRLEVSSTWENPDVIVLTLVAVAP